MTGTPMEQHAPFLMYVLQGVLGLLLAVIAFYIKKMDAKMDSFQTKEMCGVHHAAHDKHHELEKEMAGKELKGIRHDLTNGLNSVRNAR